MNCAEEILQRIRTLYAATQVYGCRVRYNRYKRDSFRSAVVVPTLAFALRPKAKARVFGRYFNAPALFFHPLANGLAPEMSKLNHAPIRLADLSEPPSVPRACDRPCAEVGSPIAKHHSTIFEELAEMRAHFASESDQSVALLKPVTIDDLNDLLESDSEAADNFDEVLSLPCGLQPPRTTRVWGLDYHAVDMEQTLDYLEQVICRRQPSYAVTANLNYAMLCAKNPRLAAFTKDSVLTLCDGMPILWRSKFNKTKLPERVAGSDLIYRLTQRCADKKLRVYFYGASEGIAEKAAETLKALYPGLLVAGVQCPPFRACSSEGIRSQIAGIKQAKPDLLLVALGQPKGEYWIEDHLEELGIPLTIQLGASFDFVAGNAVRAPKLLQKAGMEWLYRTLKDPKRLAPRYLANFLFLVKAVRQELIEKLS